MAGALAINVGISKTNAQIDDGTTVTVTGNSAVDVKAENFIVVTAKGTGKQTEYALRIGRLLKQGDSKANVRLQPGDVIIIPTSAF